jgi:hypothetical protein
MADYLRIGAISLGVLSSGCRNTATIAQLAGDGPLTGGQAVSISSRLCEMRNVANRLRTDAIVLDEKVFSCGRGSSGRLAVLLGGFNIQESHGKGSRPCDGESGTVPCRNGVGVKSQGKLTPAASGLHESHAIRTQPALSTLHKRNRGNRIGPISPDFERVFQKPPTGFEPATYALRKRRSTS